MVGVALAVAAGVWVAIGVGLRVGEGLPEGVGVAIWVSPISASEKKSLL